MAGESNFSLQIANLVGGATIDQEFCDDAAKDACKEIISQLPAKLKAKCATRSTLNASATTLDLDSKGDILHATRLSADSGGFEKVCREIPGMYGDLTNDSADLNYYATATDPVYFITNNSSGNPTLFVRPNPTNTQPAYIHHITYPTVDVSADTLEIANFPDEATHLVVLYASARQLLKFQATMSATFNSDITGAFTSMNAITDAQPVPPDVPSLTSISFSSVDSAVDATLVNIAVGDVLGSTTQPTYTTPTQATNSFADVNTALDNEDMELATARINEAQLIIQDELNEFNEESIKYQASVQESMNEFQSANQIAIGNAERSQSRQFQNAVQDAKVIYDTNAQSIQKYQAESTEYQVEIASMVQTAQSYAAEAAARLQADSTKYQWYGDQYVKLSAEYARGLASLTGKQVGGGDK